MVLLLFYLFLALGVSFVCSILEAVILSVTPSFIEEWELKNPKKGRKLRNLKTKIDQPLAAILSLNTIAHTVGAAGVGAQSFTLFGSAYVAVTSGILTFLILFFSEIIPKTLGAYHWQKLVGITIRILPILIWLLFPLVFLAEKIADWLASEKQLAAISRDQIRAMTELARKGGVFTEQESRIMKNLMRAGKLRIKDFMTPRTVMFTLPSDMTIDEVMQKHPQPGFSRIPIYNTTPEDINSFVLKDDIVVEASRDHHDLRLSALAREIPMVPENTSLLSIFEELLNKRVSIAIAVDEYGGIEGMVTMEDIVETLLGIEIVDETDITLDMQAMARRQWAVRSRSLQILSDVDPKPPEQS